MVNKINVKEFLQTRPLSWSALSSFEYDPEQWYKRYILNEKMPETIEMIFGKVLANSIENGKPLVPVTIIHPEKIVKGENVEHPFKVVFNGIPLIGFVDTFCHRTFRKLGEFKSGKKPWDQKRVDEHGQIDMYLLQNFITNKVPPGDVECFLEWVPTEETGDFKIQFVKPINIHHFKTKRTMVDILNFGARINSTVEAMQRYVDEKSLSPL